MTGIRDNPPSIYRAKPLKKIGQMASLFVAVSGACLVVLGFYSGYVIYVLVRSQGDSNYQPPFATLFVSVYSIAYYLFYIFFISGAVAFFFWTYRATANVLALNPTAMSIRPGWAVGWYFVPIWLLWKPYQAVRQIWQASHDISDPGSIDVPRILIYWWACWIAFFSYAVFNFLNGFLKLYFGVDGGHDAIGILIRQQLILIVFLLVLAASCFFLFRIIREITRAQATLASNTAGIFE